MNYLAHIFLSGDDRRVQIGNFVGDAVKGRAYENYPLGFREGILLYREIDDYTDHHPVVREVVDMLRGGFGRYSGVFSREIKIGYRSCSIVSCRMFKRNVV